MSFGGIGTCCDAIREFYQPHHVERLTVVSTHTKLNALLFRLTTADPSERVKRRSAEESASKPRTGVALGEGGVQSLSTPAVVSAGKTSKHLGQRSPRASPLSKRRVRAHSFGTQEPPEINMEGSQTPSDRASLPPASPRSSSGRRIQVHDTLDKAKSRDALRVNDSMVYLDGPQVYTCAQCRTHLTSHDDIISKSFHGRHGRAYLFDQCVNVTIGPSEERRLITGLHTVCDICCKRCKTLVGWTYLKAYETSQKYKEGKYIIEKINLHLEESDYYDVAPPAGERTDRWRQRSMSWGDSGSFSEPSAGAATTGEDGTLPSVVFEYRPSAP